MQFDILLKFQVVGKSVSSLSNWILSQIFACNVTNFFRKASFHII